MAQVYSKTPKGLRETTGKTRALEPELVEVLKACKDNQTADEIAAAWPEAERKTIVWAVGELTKAGYLREFFVDRGEKSRAVADEGMDLDFSSIASAPTPPVKPSPEEMRVEAENRARRDKEEKARRETEEKLRGEAEEKIRREAREKARIEAEEKARIGALEWARREAAEKVRREAEEQARRETEEKARTEAEKKARVEAEERARREAEEKIRREAEEKARHEAEEQAKRAAVEKIRREALEKFRREEEEKARREAEEKARIEAEEKARIEAEEKAKIEAEERARREAEEKIRREAEEKARIEAEEKARIEAEERARIEAEERARREAEENIRREAEEKARRKAEEQARKEAEERARLEEEERDRERIQQRMLERREVRKRQSRVVAIVTIINLLFVALFLIKFLPFDGRRQAFETMAASALGVSVKAASAHVELVPKMKLTLNDVVLGDAGDRVRVKRVVLGAPLSVLWQMPAEFDSLHLEDAHLPVPVLMNLLGTGAGKLPLTAGAFSASRLILAVEPAFLPPLDVEAKVAEGRLAEFVAQVDGAESGKVKLDGTRGPEAWNVSLSAERLDLPFAGKLKLTDFSANGQLSPDRLTVSGFKGWHSNGEFGGNLSLTWKGSWKLGGKISATRVSAAAIAPGWFKDGVFDAQGEVIGIAAKVQEVLPRAQIQAQVGMSRGVLAGVDFDRILQGRGQGDQFSFESLKANLLYDGGRIDASDIRLTAGDLSASGAVAIAADQAARGKLAVEVKSSRLKVGVSVGGTATSPKYQR